MAWRCLAPQVSAATAAWEEALTAAQTSWCLAQWWTASQRKVSVVLNILYILICTFHTYNYNICSRRCYLCWSTLRWGVRGVLQRWGRNWTRGALWPRRPEGTAPRGAAPPGLTSPQPTAHGRGAGSWCRHTCCERGGRGKDSADSGCDGGETTLTLYQKLTSDTQLCCQSPPPSPMQCKRKF